MGAIDAHTHAFPDKLARRAITMMEQRCPFRAVGDGTVSGLLASMDAADIDLSVVCSIATRPDQVASILRWCKKHRSDRIEPLASVHPETPQAERWLAKFAQARLAGIKLHPMYQDFTFDDPRMDGIYAAACEHKLLVTVHCGRDIGFPADDDRAAPKRIAAVLDRFPDLKLLCTHMGGWRTWDETTEHLIGREVYLETSFSLDKLPREQAVEMIHKHGVDRVCLGSDWPWFSQKESLEQVRRLGLEPKQTDAIVWGNAARILGY